jgi:NADP-dependent 3-hydroxy acid dehydrogenase YdfG
VKRIRDELADVTVLINNAAVVWPLGASTSIDPAQWTAAISINVVAVASLTFLLLPASEDCRLRRIDHEPVAEPVIHALQAAGRRAVGAMTRPAADRRSQIVRRY